MRFNLIFEERVDMSFPTSGELAGFAELMRFQSLENLLRQRAPEFADRIERPDTSPFYLKVRLDDGADVLLGWTSKPPGAWFILDSEMPPRIRVWSLETPEEVLIKALRMRASARLSGASEPSPWRWDEAADSTATQLGDLLEAEGFSVTSVVAGNRTFAVDPEAPNAAEVWIAQASDGDYVRASLGPVKVRVALKPILGWIADVLAPDESHWRRLDLRRLVAGQPSVVPGVPAESLDVPLLARTVGVAVAGLIGTPGSESLSPALLPHPSSMRSSGTKLTADVAAQLHAMAFGDIEVHDDSVAPLRSATFHIVWRVSQEGRLVLSELQRLKGIAATAEKPLMVISAGGVTRPALHFADEAKSFVFYLDPRAGVLFNGNRRCAEAYLTGWSEWISTRSKERAGY